MTLKLKGKEAEAEEAEAEETDADQSEGEEGQEGEDKAKSEAQVKQAEMEAENVRLREENEQLRRTAPVPAQAQSKISASQLRAMNDEQKEYIEKVTNMPFATVLSNVEAQERQTDESERASTRALVNVRDAIDDLVDRDPQAAKLKGGVREYLADIPDSEKADPARLKKHIAKAVIYAKGKAGVPAPARSGARQERSPRPDEEGGEAEAVDAKSGKINPGSYEFNGLKLEIKELLPKDKMAKIRHPEHPTGILIPPGFDEAPRFR